MDGLTQLENLEPTHIRASDRALIVLSGPVGGYFVQWGIRPHCLLSACYRADYQAHMVSIMASPVSWSRLTTGARCLGAML